MEKYLVSSFPMLQVDHCRNWSQKPLISLFLFG